MIKPPPYNSESGVNVTLLFFLMNTLLQTVASVAQAACMSAAWDENAVVVIRATTVARHLEAGIRILLNASVEGSINPFGPLLARLMSAEHESLKRKHQSLEPKN